MEAQSAPSAVDYVVAIPARFASTRLAGKPLVLVGDKPMIAQVCLKALQSTAKEVIACVDHEKIVAALQPYAANEPRLKICMTSDKPRSGTERIAEMITTQKLDPETIVVNVQGDEPLITQEHINQVANLLASSGADMATLCAPITEVADVFDPNCVKVLAVPQSHLSAITLWHGKRPSRKTLRLHTHSCSIRITTISVFMPIVCAPF